MKSTDVTKQRKQTLLAASIAGLIALAGVAVGQAQAHAADEACYGVNKCKGTGACGGKGHSCAGKNACKGQGWLHIDSDTCMKIEGGRLTPELDEE